EENPREDFHLIFKCGMLSRYHRHDDDLNILLYAYGEHWLIDSGMYNHQQKDPIRIYMRSPLAHNIPVVNGVNTIRDPSKAKENWGIYEWYQTKECKIVKAKTGMYKGLNIYREIRVDQKNNILIKDIIIQKDLPKRPVWLFHVPSDKTITKQSNGVNILGKSQILNLEIMQDNLRTVEIYSGFNTMHPSVVSKKQGVLDDSYVVVIEPFDHNVLEFSFYFSAGKNRAGNGSVLSGNSLCQGRLCII
ncbi:MAG: heparinase II/III family protein, partial [Thermotogota bacterium]|nr:heparinase II/III family protein [Thermotogota bacterium]